MIKIRLKKNEDRRIRSGHPWVFSNEIERIDGVRVAGVSAELFDAGGLPERLTISDALKVKP